MANSQLLIWVATGCALRSSFTEPQLVLWLVRDSPALAAVSVAQIKDISEITYTGPYIRQKLLSTYHGVCSCTRLLYRLAHLPASSGAPASRLSQYQKVQVTIILDSTKSDE
jgi:hypothetical protein